MNMNHEYTRLTEEERAEMRARLKLFMAEHPVRRTFVERLFVKAPSAMPGVTFMRPAVALLLIVLLIGGGTTYTAADALPGDVLYPIKVSVNEPIAGAFALSPEAKAQWEATLAARRLEEAGALALQGRLTEDARLALEERFEKHTAQFEKNTSRLAVAEEKLDVAADTQSFMEVSLKAHADVLTEVTELAPEAKAELLPIVEKARSRAGAVESARVATEEVIATKIGNTIAAAAEAKRRIAERELEREAKREEDTVVIAAMVPEIPQETPVVQPVPATPFASEETMPAMAFSMNASVAEDAARMTTSLETEDQKKENEEGRRSKSSEIVQKEEDREEKDNVYEALREGSEKLEAGKPGEAFTSFQKAIRTVEKKKLDDTLRKKLKLNTPRR